MPDAYLLSGVRRSGIHGIAYWMLAHYRRGLSLLVNNLDDLHDQWLTRPTWRIRACCNLIFDQGEALAPADSERLLHKGLAYDAVLTTLEDKSTWLHDAVWSEIGLRLALEAVQSRYVLRSVYNVVASREASERRYCLYNTPITIAVWKQHARAAIANPAGAIFYDRWHAEAGYRRDVAKSLRLPNPGAVSRDTVPPMAAGSSFQPDTPGRSLNANSRWGMIDWSELQWVLDDDELRELNTEAFGWALTRTGEKTTASAKSAAGR